MCCGVAGRCAPCASASASASARARARGDRRPPPSSAPPILCSEVEKLLHTAKNIAELLDNVLAASSRDCRLGPGMTRWLRASNGGSRLAARRALNYGGSWLAGGHLVFF